MKRLRRLPYLFKIRTAGQEQSCYRVHDAASGLPLPHSLTPMQELLPAYYSSTPIWNPIQAIQLARQQHKTTAFQPTGSPTFASQASASTLRQQAALATVSSLAYVPGSRTISQPGPAAAVHRGQSHTSVSQHVPSPSELNQSVAVPQLKSTARQSGPDISLLNAVQQRQWDHASNAHLGNVLIKPQSHRKAHWICTQCPDSLPHRWEAQVDQVYASSKATSRGCPYCSGRDVCAHNSLARKAPHLVQEWDTSRNDHSPNDYTFGSHQHAHWVCARGHTWRAGISDRVKDNKGCPECATARRGQKAPTLTASSGKIMQVWDHIEDAKAGLDPSRLTHGSHRRAHFRCPEGHQWITAIYRIARKATTSGCPYCSGRLKTKPTE